MRRLRDLGGEDGGFTLVELVVSMGLLTFVMAGFYLMFFAFGNAATNSRPALAEPGLHASGGPPARVRHAKRRSTRPVAVERRPGSDRGQRHGQHRHDRHVPAGRSPDSPCARPTTTTTSPLPSPFRSTFTGTFIANVVWVYNPTTHILARYSTSANCSGALTWQTGQEVTLYNVKNASGTMFTITSAGTQVTISGATADQAAATCASAIIVSIITQPKGQTVPFKISVTLPLPNQLALKGFACS